MNRVLVIASWVCSEMYVTGLAMLALCAMSWVHA